ncbi:MAG: GNAT family N-acetyltransferase [Sedimentisphaerales bacterium]|nr:GNAT family N-acetyltransferase [Sedimentisphaerales bacterium]
MQDGGLLRELHLRMYADSPDAFGESLAQAQAMPMEQWEGRARKLAEGEQAVGFVAMEGARAVGFIGGFVGQYRDGSIHGNARGTATITRAWVDPQMRRKGIARALAQAVEAWAWEQGVSDLEVQVTENNAPAIEFYRSQGFADTGRREPLLSNPTLRIRFLSRSLLRTQQT